MKKRKILSFVMTFFLIICISGCGQKSSGDSQEAAVAKAESITLVNIKSEVNAQIQTLASQYEKETGIKVSVINVDPGVDSQATLKGYYLSDQMPDIIACEASGFSNWEGLLVDLSDQNWA